jgi:thioredoxin-like negative regulator of GroEL
MIFYSNYSYDCLYTEEFFAELSIKYYGKNLTFGKMNVDLNESLMSKLMIDLHYNVTLPYMIMFKNGKEIERLPGYDSKGKPRRMKYYREKDIVDIFQLKSIISTN